MTDQTMTNEQRLRELSDVLRTLLAESFRGHTVADRLQFSSTGRELLRRAEAAMLPNGPLLADPPVNGPMAPCFYP